MRELIEKMMSDDPIGGAKLIDREISSVMSEVGDCIEYADSAIRKAKDTQKRLESIRKTLAEFIRSGWKK